MQKPTISIITSKWGHLSIAKAVQEINKNEGFQTYLNFIRIGKKSEELYSIFYRLFPKFFKLPFKLAENSKLSILLKIYLESRYKAEIYSDIKRQKPDIIINTHFAFNSIIEKLLATNNKLKFINIVADPRTIHKMLLSQKAYNFVFDQKAKFLCHKMGIPSEKIVVSGWFLRQDFHKKYEKEAVRKLLKFPPETFTIAIIGGSAGAYNIVKIFPALINPPKRLHAIFICGESQRLFTTLKTLSKVAAEKGSKLKITVYGFKSNIHLYLQASDIVIGKAGPNLLFESVTTKTPFFAISHISGQEDGNLSIIKEYKLGFVEENPIKATKLLRTLIRSPEKLKRFDGPLEKMAGYNAQAPLILQKLVTEITKN